MDERSLPAPDDDSPSPLSAQQFIGDFAASEADEAAGRTDSGADLLAKMDQAATQIRSNVGLRRI
jgi:hypothetical protein